MQNRIILHCDCNSFFASVELLSHPELVGKPVAVGGNAENRHGVILAKNWEAQKYNIKTAETVWQAKQKCPDLVILPANHAKYTHYCKVLNNIYARYTDRVESFGIDESWLDVTGSYKLFADTPKQLADIIRKTITEETGLTISVGVSFNKVFSKLGSDYKKPNATTVIMADDVEKIVYPQPVENLLYVGKMMRENLKEMNIVTIGDLAREETEVLIRNFGKAGLQVSQYAKGIDTSVVRFAHEKQQLKSVGNGNTFKRNLQGLADIQLAVTSLSETVGLRLRKNLLKCTGVQVTIKDSELKSISRQKKLEYATDLTKDIKTTAEQLIKENWSMQKPIRMLTVTAINLTTHDYTEQISFFEDIKKPDAKQQQLERAMDGIRDKYGKSAILSANILKNDLGISFDEDEQDYQD